MSVPKRDGLDRVFVTNTKLINVLYPSFFCKEIDDTALLSVTFNDNTYSLVTYIQSNQDGIYLSLMNDFMVEMGYLNYDGFTVDLDCALIPDKLKGVYIVNDLQIAFYDEDELRNNFQKSKLIFNQDLDGEIVYRYIYDGSKLIEKVEINHNKVNIVNYLRNYQYSLIFEQSF